MIAKCPVCKIEYNIKRPMSDRLRCAACGKVWIGRIPGRSAGVKAAIALAAFVICLAIVFAAVRLVENSKNIAPLRLQVISVKIENGQAEIRGKIFNQTDNLLQVPEIKAVVLDSAGGLIFSANFWSGAPLLIGGESVEFVRSFEYNATGAASVALEFLED